jgi:putative DNA primase/helicase
MANAARFAQAHAESVRFCWAWDAWLVYDGRRWARDPGEAVMVRAKATARTRWRAAVALPVGEERRRAVRFADYSESARGLRAMLELARSEPGISITPEAFDADPWLLNTPSGTLDLRTGTRRPWDRADYCSHLTAAAYEPGATHPTLTRFLETSLPELADREYVQTALGYSITGSTAEEQAYLIHGPTAAGKTTLLEAVKAALGPHYAMAADFETFRPRKHEAAPREDLVRLKRARLVVVAETRATRLDAAVLKRMTGGDTAAGRQLYEGTQEYRPLGKVWMAGNVRPVVDSDDDAVFRRLREVPFPRSLGAEERDPAVKATLTDPAVGGPAVLAWLVAGAMRWHQEGLHDSPAVRTASAAYRAAMDHGLGEFVAEWVLAEPDAWVARDVLRAKLAQWLQADGITSAPSGAAVAAALRRAGATDRKRGGERGWLGVRLRSGDDPEPAALDAGGAVSAWR